MNKKIKINYRSPYFIALLILAAAIILPNITFTLSIEDAGGNETGNYVVLHKDSLFGSEIRKVFLDNGASTYITAYNWYEFPSLMGIFSGLKPSNIYGITCDDDYRDTWYSSSNILYMYCYTDSDPIEITINEQNDLDFTNSNNFFFDGRETAKASKVAMYEGIAGDDEYLSEFTHNMHSYDYVEGPFEYAETWTSEVYVYPVYYQVPQTASFTIQETLYVDTWNVLVDGYDTDRGWVYVSVMDSPADAEASGEGIITVSITDNLLSYEADVQMYCDGKKAGDVFWVPEGGKELTLDLNHYYKFDVVPRDGQEWTTWAYDAVPQQRSYDYNEGDVYLTAERNTVNYIITGDDENTAESGFDEGSVLLDYSYVWDMFDEDADSHTWDEYLIALLFGITLLGIPLLFIGIIIFLGYRSLENPVSMLDEIEKKIRRK